MRHIDSHTVICETLSQFRNELRNREIKTSVIAWRAEWAPATDTPGATHGDVVFGSLRETTLLGYQRATGTVVRLELRGPEADRSTLRAVLESDGLTVEERSRNLS